MKSLWVLPPSSRLLKQRFQEMLTRKGNLNSLRTLFEEILSLSAETNFYLRSAAFETKVNRQFDLNTKNQMFLEALKALPPGGEHNIYKLFLSILGVEASISGVDKNSLVLTKNQPVLMVANHGYPPLDGLGIMASVAQHRSDLGVMVNTNNALLQLYKGLANNVIPIQMSSGLMKSRDQESIRRSQISAMRQSISRLIEGNALLVFPAGQGSKALKWDEPIKDTPWFNGVEVMARKVVEQNPNLLILPLYVSSHMGGVKNSAVYQEAVIESPVHLAAAIQSALLNPPPHLEIKSGTPILAKSLLAEINFTQTLRKIVYGLSTHEWRATRLQAVENGTASVFPLRPATES